MGFGLFFIGYFIAFLMSVNNYGFAFEIIGYAVMLTAIGKLSEYKRSLSRATLPLFLMALCSAYDGIKVLCETLSLNIAIFNEQVILAVSLASAAFTVLFHIMTLLSFRAIAADAEETSLEKGAMVVLVISSLAGLLEFLLALLGNLLGNTPELGIFALITTLLRILYPITVLILVFYCYARLCAPEDVDMPRRPSRFAFINRWRAKQDEKAEEVKKLREEYQQKLEEKARNKRNANQKNKKK